MSLRRYWALRLLAAFAAGVACYFMLINVREWWLQVPMVLIVAVIFSLIEQSLHLRREDDPSA